MRSVTDGARQLQGHPGLPHGRPGKELHQGRGQARSVPISVESYDPRARNAHGPETAHENHAQRFADRCGRTTSHMRSAHISRTSRRSSTRSVRWPTSLPAMSGSPRACMSPRPFSGQDCSHCCASIPMCMSRSSWTTVSRTSSLTALTPAFAWENRWPGTWLPCGLARISAWWWSRHRLTSRDREQPRTPQDLTTHNCINLRFPTYGGIYVWEFERGGREINVRVDGQLIFNSSKQILDAALAGFGLAYLPEDTAAPHLERGRLAQVLDPWCAPFPGYHIYYPSRRQSSPALQLVVDALRYKRK